MSCGCQSLPVRVARVAVTVAKAIAGTHRPGRSIEQDRIRACKACPKYAFATCRVCGCAVVLKVRVETETCPLGRWPG